MVQKKHLSKTDIRTGIFLSLVIASVLYVVLMLTAGLAADFMNIPEIEQIIPIVGVLLLIMSLRGISGGVMMREGRAPALSLAQLCSNALSTWGVILPLALFGFSYWSIVWGSLANAGFELLFVWRLARNPLRPEWNRESARELMSKGIGYFGTRFSSFVASKSDNIMVGRYFGAVGLGYYGRAFRIMEYPAAIYQIAVERIAFPTMSRIQDDHERLQRATLRGFALTSLIGMPISIFYMVASVELVEILLLARMA